MIPLSMTSLIGNFFIGKQNFFEKKNRKGFFLQVFFVQKFFTKKKILKFVFKKFSQGLESSGFSNSCLDFF